MRGLGPPTVVASLVPSPAPAGAPGPGAGCPEPAPRLEARRLCPAVWLLFPSPDQGASAWDHSPALSCWPSSLVLFFSENICSIYQAPPVLGPICVVLGQTLDVIPCVLPALRGALRATVCADGWSSRGWTGHCGEGHRAHFRPNAMKQRHHLPSLCPPPPPGKVLRQGALRGAGSPSAALGPGASL